MVAVVELDKAKPIRSVGADCLEQMRSWVFFPRGVTVEYSLDGEHWNTFGSVLNNRFPPIHQRQEESTQHTFTVNGSARAKYIKVTVRNFGELPAWHVSAGEQAWVFVDEIIVK